MYNFAVVQTYAVHNFVHYFAHNPSTDKINTILKHKVRNISKLLQNRLTSVLHTQCNCRLLKYSISHVSTFYRASAL